MSTPVSVIHACSVCPASENGRPAEKPSSSTIRTRGLKYTATPSNHDDRVCVPGGTVIALFAGFQLVPDRRLYHFGARGFVIEFDALNSVAAVDDLVRRNDDLLDVSVGLPEVLVEIFDAVTQALHIADQMPNFDKDLVGGLAHLRVLADLLDHLDRQHQQRR